MRGGYRSWYPRFLNFDDKSSGCAVGEMGVAGHSDMVTKRSFSGVERSDHQKALILIILYNRLDNFSGPVSIKSYRKQ